MTASDEQGAVVAQWPELFWYRAVVLRVIDGDTLSLDVDLGFNVHRRETVRLMHVDTPELRTAAGVEAHVAVQAWVAAATGVLAHTVKDRADKYGRMLAEIWRYDDPVSLNDWLLAEGLALPYEGGTR